MMSYRHLTVNTYRPKMIFTALSLETDSVTTSSNVTICNFKDGNHVDSLPLIQTRDPTLQRSLLLFFL